MKSENGIEFVHFPGISGLDLVRGSRVTTGFPLHTHDSYTVGIVEHGARLLQLRNKTATIPTGGVFTLNPEEPHACASSGKGGHGYIVVNIAAHRMKHYLAEMLGASIQLPRFRRQAFRDDAVYRCVQALWAAAGNTALSRDGEECLALLLSSLIQSGLVVSRPSARSEGLTERVKRAKEFIESNYDAHLTLEQIASIAGLSVFHFTRMFKEEVGMPPRAYHVQVRTKAARRLLTEGVSIAETALQVGFVDQSHFTRFFKRMTGITPGWFVRSVKGEVPRLAGRQSRP